jgi:hypothetical protein
MYAWKKIKVAAFGLLAAAALVSCASSSKIVENRNTIEATRSVQIAFDESSINQKIDSFAQALKIRGRALTESDWALHDELLDTYIALKSQAANPNLLRIPARGRLSASLPSFCLDPNLASPSANEAFKWQRESLGLPYFKELIDLKSKGEVSQEKIQTILWNLKKKTFWESYPEELKTILLKIDSNAATKLPSRLVDTLKTSALDLLKGQVPVIGDVQDVAKQIEGEFDRYADIAEEIRSRTSKYRIDENPGLERLPGTEVFASTKSNGYSSQEVTFHNPTPVEQTVDLDNYYIKSSRRDVQRIGLSAPQFPNRNSVIDRLEGVLYGSMLRLGIGFTPIVNDVADVCELLTGKDFVSGAKLTGSERLLAGLGVIAGSGAAYRYAQRSIHSPTKYLKDFSEGLGKSAGRKISLEIKSLAEAKNELRAASDFRLQSKEFKFHSPIDPGPLHSRPVGSGSVADTFRSGTYVSYKSEKPIELYRVQPKSYVKGDRTGSYWTREQPHGPVQSIVDSALDPTWGNTAGHWVKARIPAGTQVFEGRASPQRGLVGGGSQVFIEQIKPGWVTDFGAFQ